MSKTKKAKVIIPSFTFNIPHTFGGIFHYIKTGEFEITEDAEFKIIQPKQIGYEPTKGQSNETDSEAI